MSETARIQSIYALKTEDKHLVDFRHDVLRALDGRLCSGYQQRLLFSVNEIIANLMRHATPTPTEVLIDFEKIDNVACCVIRDNGGTFAAFAKIWEKIRVKPTRPLFSNGNVGLSLVQCFCPNAYYLQKDARHKYNAFVLPLVVPTDDNVPEFFRVKEADLVKNLLKN